MGQSPFGDSPCLVRRGLSRQGLSPRRDGATLRAVFGRGAALGPLELEHQLAQEPVQLLLLSLAQRRGEECFLASLDADRLLVDALAGRGQLDQDPAPVVRIGKPAEETGFLQEVEPVRDRTARELHQPRQPARRAPVDLRLPVEQAEELPLRVVELELGERLVEGAMKAAVQPLDAVDDALYLGAEHRQPDPDRREKAGDVVSLLLLGLRGHGTILDVKLLDVKLAVVYSLDVK